ncbi:MAG: hypothetical protein AAB011_00940 [Candidatus Eisenbacteria bacterium]
MTHVRVGSPRPASTVRFLVPAMLLLSTLNASIPATAATPNPFFMQLRAARAELAHGDLDAAEAAFTSVDSIAGGLPSAIWSLAQIAARRGDAGEAIRRLEEYAAMGLARSVERDTTFVALKGDARLAAIAARLQGNAEPRATATVVARLSDAGLLAEDLAYDQRSRIFYVSSIHRRKVLAVHADGTVRDFLAPAQNGIWGVYALALDAKRDRLWGSIAAVPTMEHYDPADSGRTAVVCWNLLTGKEILRAELPRDGERHVLGDIALTTDGAVYATESIGGGIYRLRPGETSLETIATSGTFGSPQMPVVRDYGRALWIADYPRGITSFDPVTGAIVTVEKPRSLAGMGIDGLYAAPGGLLAIQNGTRPVRILWLMLDNAGRRIESWSVLEQDSPDLGEPNHGVVTEDSFYFLGNSGWDRVNAREELEIPEGAAPPAILRLPLPLK